MGGSADHRYNLSFIVQNSVRMGSPMIGISINYRLSAFGFIGGQEVLRAGVANLGFRDQRLALSWVNENIAAFGGSPDKVTIFGESSGAESVTAQVLAYGGMLVGLFLPLSRFLWRASMSPPSLNLNSSVDLSSLATQT